MRSGQAIEGLGQGAGHPVQHHEVEVSKRPVRRRIEQLQAPRARPQAHHRYTQDAARREAGGVVYGTVEACILANVGHMKPQTALVTEAHHARTRRHPHAGHRPSLGAGGGHELE